MTKEEKLLNPVAKLRGDIIYRRAEEKRIKKRDLARHIGMSRNQFHEHLTGNVKGWLNAEQERQLRNLLDLTEDDLHIGERDPHTKGLPEDVHEMRRENEALRAAIGRVAEALAGLDPRYYRKSPFSDE